MLSLSGAKSGSTVHMHRLAIRECFSAWATLTRWKDFVWSGETAPSNPSRRRLSGGTQPYARARDDLWS